MLSRAFFRTAIFISTLALAATATFAAGGSAPTPWQELFDSSGSPQGSNELIFIADDVSAGISIDETARACSEGGICLVGPRLVAPENDLTNAYLSFQRSEAGNLLLAAGFERLVAKGPAYINLELNQRGASDYGQSVGRDSGDLLLRINFTDGGAIQSVELGQWTPSSVPAAGLAGFQSPGDPGKGNGIDICGNPGCGRFFLRQADTTQLGVGENRIGHRPTGDTGSRLRERIAFRGEPGIPKNAVIIVGNVGEGRAPLTVANGPGAFGAGGQ